MVAERLVSAGFLSFSRNDGDYWCISHLTGTTEQTRPLWLETAVTVVLMLAVVVVVEVVDVPFSSWPEKPEAASGVSNVCHTSDLPKSQSTGSAMEVEEKDGGWCSPCGWIADCRSPLTVVSPVWLAHLPFTICRLPLVLAAGTTMSTVVEMPSVSFAPLCPSFRPHASFSMSNHMWVVWSPSIGHDYHRGTNGTKLGASQNERGREKENFSFHSWMSIKQQVYHRWQTSLQLRLEVLSLLFSLLYYELFTGYHGQCVMCRWSTIQVPGVNHFSTQGSSVNLYDSPILHEYELQVQAATKNPNGKYNRKCPVIMNRCLSDYQLRHANCHLPCVICQSAIANCQLQIASSHCTWLASSQL